MSAVRPSYRRRAPQGWGEALLRRRRAVLAVIFVFAVGVHVASTVATVGTTPEITGDMESYDEFATAILHGDWWGHHVSYREPGYPLFVALVYKLTGSNQLAARLVNALLSALTCIVVYLLGKRTLGAGVGLAAAAWFAVYYHSVHFSAYLLREPLVTLLLTLTLLWCVRAVQSRRSRDAAVASVLFLLLVHTDARFLFHAPFLLLYVLIASGARRDAVRMAAVWTLVFVVGMIPWQVRNYQIYKHVVLVNTRTLVLPAPWRGAAGDEPVEGLEPPPPDTREGVRHVHGLRGALYDFTELYRIFRFRGEVRANSNTWEKPWSAFHNWSSIAMYGTLVPFFIYGFWVIVRRRLLYAYVFVLPVLAHTILHVVKWGRERYRMPIEPLLIIVAFYGLFVLWRAWAKRAKRGAEEATA